MDELPHDFDTIVVGTGLPESILAAAHARNGRSVLHIDRNEWYGGMWSTFNLDGLEKWLLQSQNAESTSVVDSSAPTESLLLENERVIPCAYKDGIYSNFKKSEYLCEGKKDSELQSFESGHTAVASSDVSVTAVVTQLKDECEDTVVDNPHSSLESEPVTETSNQCSETTNQCSETTDKTATQAPPTADSEPTDVSAASDVVVAEEKVIDGSETRWSMEKIRSLQRKFNLDLAPKLLFSRGDLVDLLISSNIARYSEFKSVTRVLTHLDEKLEQVPCSRSDVFTTKNVSIVEKRMLMKLLTFCLTYEQNPDEYRGFENKTFVEFLKSRKLTPNVQHYVLHAIAMLPESGFTLEGLECTKRFLDSLGRYGNTPFLWPLYGSGELPQCFCRMCAVFGGIYYLKRGVESIIVNEENVCCAIISDGKRFNCKYLVMEANFAPASWMPDTPRHDSISRAILLTNRSILPVEKEQITLLRLPALNGLVEAVCVIELGSSSMASPPGIFVVHLTCKRTVDAESDLKPAVDLLFDRVTTDWCDASGSVAGDKPRVLWSLYFNQIDNSSCDFRSCPQCPPNVTLTPGPSGLIDFDGAVKQAKLDFQRAFPEEEMLPRAPDPEEIVMEGGEEVAADPDSSSEKLQEEENSGQDESSAVSDAAALSVPTDHGDCGAASPVSSCEQLAANSLPCTSSVPKEE